MLILLQCKDLQLFISYMAVTEEFRIVVGTNEAEDVTLGSGKLQWESFSGTADY